MYLRYIRYKGKATVQENTEYKIFDNIDNLENILKCKNKIIILKMIKERTKFIKDEEEKYLKTIYLDSKIDIELKIIERLEKKSHTIYSENKETKNLNVNDFIEDLDNKLNLINYYLNIKDAIKNNKDLNISFNSKENQKKKLQFINLCLNNISDPESFINNLIKKDGYYSIKKQKIKELKKI